MSLLSAYIKHVRSEKGLTVRAAADLVGVDPSSLSRLERGEIATPSEELLGKLAEGLGRPKAEVYLAAGRITAELAEKLEQGIPIGLFQVAKVLAMLESELQDLLTPIGTTPLMQHLRPEDAATMQRINDALSYVAEMADGITRGLVTPKQFEHVVENIRQLKLALLNRDMP